MGLYFSKVFLVDLYSYINMFGGLGDTILYPGFLAFVISDEVVGSYHRVYTYIYIYIYKYKYFCVYIYIYI